MAILTLNEKIDGQGQCQGSAKQANGDNKEATGKLTGDARLQADAKATRPKAKFRTPPVASWMYYAA